MEEAIHDQVYQLTLAGTRRMYTRMLVQVRQCKMQTCTIHMHNATTKPRKPREAETKTYKANQTKVSDQKG